MSARTLPTSRAYWELRAEQVMDRVFTPVDAVDGETSPAAEDPDSPIDVLVRDEGPTGAAHRPPGTRQPGQARSPQPCSRAWGLRAWPGSWTLPAALPARSRQLVALSSVVCLTMGGLSLVLWRNWSVARQDLRQERNLLLLERLRDLGPNGATTAAAKAELSEAAEAAKAKAKAKDEQANAEGLPPPPAEAWMEELATLPQSSAPAAEVLRVPLSSAISRPAPAATGGGGAAAATGGSLPQLVGVVQVPGRAGSAIFQLGGSSSSAAVGESIGGSGWRLRSASGDTAVIERDGEQRQVSISSGF